MRTLLVTTLFCLVSPFLTAKTSFEELTISQLQQGVENGEFSYLAVTEFYLTQIEKLNPTLNAVITINPHAKAEAAAKDLAFKQGKQHGVLFGVPVLLKDNIDTTFLPTTAGALALANNIPSSNADIVNNLLAEGAIILGKANLSEWANFKSMKSSSGFSALGGQTRNPYNLSYTPCGSSSGSAVAVAANMSLVSIGTETDGSIHCPAAMNSVVGFKPTITNVSQRGIIPIAHSQDTAGPMARTVADAKKVYFAMAGSRAAPANKALNQVRIGVIPELYGFNKARQAEFDAIKSALKKTGVVLVDKLSFNHIEQVYNAEFDILLYEFKQDLNRYLQTTGDTVAVKSLAELTAFNQANGDEQQDLLLSSLSGPAKERYLSAKAQIENLAKRQLRELFAKHQLDAIIAPTVGAAWKIDPEYGDKFSGSTTTLAAVTGFPSITLPMGSKAGMPYAISLIGYEGTDAEVLSLAEGIESILGKRIIPTLAL
jgi:amidase